MTVGMEEGLDDMKRWTLFALLLLPVVASAAEREFATLDGNRILGEIDSYDLKSDMVTIQTFGKKKVSMKASTLRDEDFKFIRDWDASRLFMQNTHFRMYIDGPQTRAKFTKYLWRRPPGWRSRGWTRGLRGDVSLGGPENQLKSKRFGTTPSNFWWKFN